MTIVIPYEERLPLKRAHDVYLFRTCHALARAGHTVHLLVGWGSLPTWRLFAYYDLEPCDGMRVHLLPLVRRSRGLSWSTPFHVAAWWTIGQLAATGAADLIFASTLKLARVLLDRRYRLPLVYDLHELAALPEVVVRRRLVRLEAQVLSKVHGIVVTTRALAAEVRRAYPQVGPIAAVPLAAHRPRGLEPEPYPAPGPSTPQAFYVGQMYPLQGIRVALEALSRSDGPRLHLVGSGEEEANLRDLAQQLGLKERVHFSGFRAPGELQPILTPADWFLLPALAKGRMPYVAHMKCYDYLTYRRPILASDLPSVRELLTDGETALLTPPANSQALAQAMNRLLQDPELARRLGDQARELALKHLPELRAARLTEFFETVKARTTA